MTTLSVDVPYRKQQKEQWCWPAALQMVIMALHNRRVYQGPIARNAGTNKDGTGTRGMIVSAKKAGLPMDSVWHAKWVNLEEALEEGLPPIVSYNEPEDDDPHSAVLVGLTSRRVYLNDPWPKHGRNFSMTRREFYRRWNEQNRHVMIPRRLSAKPKKD